MATSKSTKPVIQRQLKLCLRPAQERTLNRWLWHLTGVYNWAIRKIELDGRAGIYYPGRTLSAHVHGHSGRMGIMLEVLRGTVHSARLSWKRCLDGNARRPKLKSNRNRLNNIPIPREFPRPTGDRIRVPGIGMVRFHRDSVPEGRIQGGRLIRRASGWHLCLFVEAEPNAITFVSDHEVGIDPGFASLLTLSTGEAIDRADEDDEAALVLAKRSGSRRRAARVHERVASRRKDRNHKLSRRLVSENKLIVWSKDNQPAIARRFGKSVARAAHGQLRSMLAYKCRSGGRQFVEVSGRYSTVTCSACGARSGPSGYAGLSVRVWRCDCGVEHGRDHNAAINTLNAGRGLRHESVGNGTPERATHATRLRSEGR